MTDTIVGGNDAPKPGRLVLLRHGQTAWSVSGQHTGRTDIPLTPTGEHQAIEAGVRLRESFPDGFAEGCVFASPLRRARQTAALAGYGTHNVLPYIAEWDYGRAEGRTRGTVSQLLGRPWDLWRDGTESLPATMDGERVETLPGGTQVTVRNGRGETLDEVAARTTVAIREVLPLIEEGHDVLLVAHAHVLRILTTQWLGMDPLTAKLLRLDTARYSVLSQYKGDNVIEQWNV
ncbi:histidine phosphatase family protein [Bifidobacterium pullorum]|uniref:histidine phosphatase family protein n=1 Tax=Bifidobacterium pullorum TaxID=78448 RepID=UPI002942C50F|nr:histidine phosphatase family protein [Bifidobacterium pullorum]